MTVLAYFSESATAPSKGEINLSPNFKNRLILGF
jgi:hypothetical protein